MDDPAPVVVSLLVVLMKSFIAILLLAGSLSAQTVAISDRGIYGPSIASSRTRVLAIWMKQLLPPPDQQAPQQQLRGELIDFSGQVIAGPFDFPSTHSASIVSDGERFLVYWSNGINVEGLFVEENGDFDQPFTIVPGASAASATFDGTRYLFFSTDGITIQLTPVTLQGIPETSFSTPIRAATVGGAATHAGVTAVTWVQSIENQVLQVGVTFFTDRKASSPMVLARMNPGYGFGSPYIACPLVAWNGPGWFVVWESGRSGRSVNIEGTRVTPDGTALDVTGPGDGFHAGGVPIDIQFYTNVYDSLPEMHAIGSQLLVTWSYQLSGKGDYAGRYINDSGEVVARISLAYGRSDVGGATTPLPDGTLVSLLASESGDAFLRFGRVARRRAAR